MRLINAKIPATTNIITAKPAQSCQIGLKRLLIIVATLMPVGVGGVSKVPPAANTKNGATKNTDNVDKIKIDKSFFIFASIRTI